ncbi:hypothetical protein M430DRAFT_248290 [Amorphotheca resinae ATCC 22711]|uniref:Uncharacterized protein n=1 Tax=Amorphotheca resinae ATCC 22711 TaxID=857342 RepID=A0A2T3B058_AMORE|nr:hypothetical protein M430DRAFT_248290 [Amorphotheca resinae ATCC 22711]PSS16781.1 hypothetical protein M430DRAFT_248290 [Amorphotheca resinae ATCC 22711]
MSLRRDRLSLQGQAQESRHRNIGAHWHSTKTHHSARRDEVSNMCRVPSGVSSDPQTYLHRDQLIKSSDESGAVGQSNYPGLLYLCARPEPPPSWLLPPPSSSRLYDSAIMGTRTTRGSSSRSGTRTTAGPSGDPHLPCSPPPKTARLPAQPSLAQPSMGTGVCRRLQVT